MLKEICSLTPVKLQHFAELTMTPDPFSLAGPPKTKKRKIGLAMQDYNHIIIHLGFQETR